MSGTQRVDFGTIKSQPIEQLIPYVRNARTHDDAQIAQIAGSIREFGFNNPVLIDGNNNIIAGHGRILAARKLGMTEAPCVVLDHMTPEQKRAYVIADNQIALNAGWNTDLLSLEIAELGDADFDLSLLGFSDLQLDGFKAIAERSEGLTDPDETPEPPENPVTKPGDLWVLGKHRVLCGDATKADDVARVLGDVQPHLMVTDPPYGVEYDANWRNEVDRKNGKPYGARAIGKVTADDQADWHEAYALFPGDVAYVWHAGNRTPESASGLVKGGYEIRAQIVWVKNNIVISRGDYHPRHEPCWYAVRKGRKGHYIGGRKQSTVWEIDKPLKSETGHSTQKPMECMRRPIENNSSPGQAVYDPFLGSGTTVIAAEQTARQCFGLEIDPVYVDVIVERWQNFTGNKAVREELDG